MRPVPSVIRFAVASISKRRWFLFWIATVLTTSNFARLPVKKVLTLSVMLRCHSNSGQTHLPILSLELGSWGSSRSSRSWTLSVRIYFEYRNNVLPMLESIIVFHMLTLFSKTCARRLVEVFSSADISISSLRALVMGATSCILQEVSTGNTGQVYGMMGTLPYR